MNKRVEEFLEDSENRSDRDQILIDAGLYDKVYLPESNESYMSLDEKIRKEYSESEYDNKKGVTVYFKKQPMEATDEEFRAIVQHIRFERKNVLAIIIAVCAYAVLIIGFFLGLYLGEELGDWGGFNTLWATIAWIISAIAGLSLLWFSEVLRLLQSINNRLRKSSALQSYSSSK